MGDDERIVNVVNSWPDYFPAKQHKGAGEDLANKKAHTLPAEAKLLGDNAVFCIDRAEHALVFRCREYCPWRVETSSQRSSGSTSTMPRSICTIIC